MQQSNRAAQLKILEPYRDIQRLMDTGHVGRSMDGGIDALYRRLNDEGNGAIRAIPFPWRQTHAASGYGFAPGQSSILAGTAGVSKSYFMLNVLLHAWKQGIRWKLLPLEDDAGRWIQRMFAVFTCSWSMVMQPKIDTPEERQRVAEAKIAVLDANQDLLRDLHDCILENPRMPVIDSTGNTISNDVNYNDVLTFVREAAADNEFIVIDPLTQITFSEDGRDYKEQSEFMREIVAIAAGSRAHIVMVAHFAKGGSKAPDLLDGIAGSSLFGKITHNAMMLIRNDPAVESRVLSRFNPTVEHRHTLILQKTRGGQSGDRIAFDLHENGPVFIEHGTIKPKVKK